MLFFFFHAALSFFVQHGFKGFRVQGLGFRVKGLGFREFSCPQKTEPSTGHPDILRPTFCTWGSLGVRGLGFRVQGLGFSVGGLGFGV